MPERQTQPVWRTVQLRNGRTVRVAVVRRPRTGDKQQPKKGRR